jgi:hypothetical protein
MQGWWIFESADAAALPAGALGPRAVGVIGQADAGLPSSESCAAIESCSSVQLDLALRVKNSRKRG